MNALVRTRSQHFVSSPRKAATPFRHKRNAPKRRRITVTTFDSDAMNVDSESDNPGPSRERSILSAETGEQTANQQRARSRKGKAVEKPVRIAQPTRDVFASGDDSSPRKRKREEVEATTSGSGSWVEVSGDEGEPELIADSDHFLLHDAPSSTLHRLRKAELVRLWKVAGMWDDETDEDAAMEDDGLDKKQLVDGIVAARFTSPRSSPKRKAAIDASYEIKRLRSATGVIPTSASSSEPKWPEATPRPGRRRARVTDVAPLRRTPGPGTAKVKIRGKRHRSKSMGGDLRARFGDDVKSPAHGLVRARTRRSSTLSSVYTTTDASPDDSPITIRGRPKRKSRGFTPRRTPKTRVHGRTPMRRTSIIEILDSSDGTESDPEPTPLVARLRSRSNRVIPDDHSEHEADVEDEDVSPQPRRQLRSRDRNIALPERGAKMRAIEALKDAESDTESSVDAMSVDDEVEEEVEDDRPGPLTRAQLRAAANHEGAFAPRHHRKDSHLSLDLTEMALSDDEVGSMAPYSSATVIADEIEMDEAEVETDGVTRTTRSGKTFGVWQSRRRRLRQEAMDDPDMEVEEEDEEDGEEEEEEFEDIDLSEATLSSLVRLLRDELVQLCEARGLEVGGTKPQLAKSLLQWYAELSDTISTTSSQATARPKSSRTRAGKIIHAVASNVHVPGKATPVLLRDHIHATDPQTPPHSDEARRGGDTDLNLDLQELGLEDSMIKPDQLQKLERIGSGGFKDVYVGKLRGRKVAISEFRSNLSEMDIRELKLLAEFSHPNIVKFKGICIPEDSTHVPCMLVSELCENGDLFDYIRNVEPQSFRRVVGLMLDIAKGLEYLHTRKPAIIHRDCKSSNILINRSLQAKVGDFGLARVKTSTRSMIRSLVGTVNWQAPELWHPHPRYDYKVDVFSAGMVYWEMLSGWTGDQKYPWEGYNEHYIYDAVGSKQRRPSVTGLRKHWGPEVVDLMERMWSQESSDRPSMTEVVKELEGLFYGSTFTPLKHH